MVLTAHVIDQLDKRCIPFKIIEYTFNNGEHIITENVIKIKSEYACIICNKIEQDRIVTAFYNREIYKQIKHLAKHNNLSFRKMVYHYVNCLAI